VNVERCPLCHLKDIPFQTDVETTRFACPVCGKFGMRFELLVDRDMQWEPHPYLSAATRKAYESGHPLILSPTTWEALEESQKLLRLPEKLHHLLRLFADRSGGPGREWKIQTLIDYPLVAARDQQELDAYLRYFEERGMLELSARFDDGNTYRLTIPGWQEIEPIPRIGGTPGRCFVAMSFDPSLDLAYELGIKRAVRACGFEVVCMKEVTTIEGITDRILAEIRRAQFVIADFTGQRGGVYFEAGFARGLGRDVISLCRKDDLPNVHFDTKHFGHLVWETPDDLFEKLTACIRANVIPKR
jgi:hypothetical protein